MAGGLMVPARFERNSGFSQSEIMNLVSGMETMNDEQVAQVLSVALGEVYDRYGPGKCTLTISLLLGTLERKAA